MKRNTSKPARAKVPARKSKRKNKRTSSAPSRKVGRPLVDLAEDIAERLAEHQSSIREMAAILGVDEKTLRNRILSDPNFAARINKGREVGKNKLRAMQYSVALSGNVSMLIWLGKQHLGQMDETRLRKHGPVNVEDLRRSLDLKNMQTGDLVKLEELLAKATGGDSENSNNENANANAGAGTEQS